MNCTSGTSNQAHLLPYWHIFALIFLCGCKRWQRRAVLHETLVQVVVLKRVIFSGPLLQTCRRHPSSIQKCSVADIAVAARQRLCMSFRGIQSRRTIENFSVQDWSVGHWCAFSQNYCVKHTISQLLKSSLGRPRRSHASAAFKAWPKHGTIWC